MDVLIGNMFLLVEMAGKTKENSYQSRVKKGEGGKCKEAKKGGGSEEKSRGGEERI